MNPEEKRLLQETVELSRENNKILHGMRRSARWSTFFRLTYWAFILGGLAVSYHYFQPYLNLMTQTYNKVQGQYGTLENALNKLPDVNKLMNSATQNSR